MADELPGLVIPITGDPSGVLRALAVTNKAVASTADVARRSGQAISFSLTRAVAGGLQGLAQVPAAAQRALGAVSNLAGKMAGVGAVAGAALGGALAMAAQQDGGVASAMASLQATTGALAVEVARAVLPAVRALTQGIADLTAGFRALDPEVKASIGSWSVFAVKALAVVGVVGKLAGLGSAVAGLLVPVLPLVVALAAAALAAGALYKALKDATGVDVSTIKNAWLDFAGTMLGFYSKLAAGWLNVVNTMRTTLRTLKEEVKDVFRPDINYADLMSPDASVRAQTQATLDARVAARQLPEDDFLVKLERKMREGLTGEDLRKALKTGVDEAGSALKYSLAGLKDLFKDIGAEFGVDKLLGGGLPGMGKGQVIGPALTPVAASVPTSSLLAQMPTFNVGDAAVLAQEQERLDAAAARRAKAGQAGLDAQAREYERERAKLPMLANAFDVFTGSFVSSMMELDREARGVVSVALSHVQGMLGKLSGVFESITQGMAAGGAMGALVGGLGSLLVGSQQAEGLKNVLDAIVQQASDAVGAVLEPIITWLGGMTVMLAPLFETVGSVLTSLFAPLEGLAASFVALAPAVAALGAVVSLAAELLGGLMEGALGIAFRALFEVFRVVGIIILGIVQGIQMAWNAIADAVNAVLGAIGSALGQDWDNVLPRADAEGTGEALSQLTKLTYEAANAKAKETAASMRLTGAMKQTAAELLNVPDVLKVTLRRFQSSQGEGLPGEAGGGSPGTGGGAPGGPAPSSGGAVNVFIGGQKLRTQIVVDARKNGTIRSDAAIEASFQGGG